MCPLRQRAASNAAGTFDVLSHESNYNINMTKILLLAIFLAVKSLYIPLNKRKSKYYLKIRLDNRIPFLPIFIVPYLGYFVWIVYSIFLLWRTEYLNKYFISYIVSYLIAGLFWYFYPNGVKRPLIKDKSILNRITSYVYSIDEDTNGFPSAHIFGTLICSFFVFLVLPNYWPVILGVTFLISVSTLFTKQHYIIDILGGIIVFVLSVFIAFTTV